MSVSLVIDGLFELSDVNTETGTRVTKHGVVITWRSVTAGLNLGRLQAFQAHLEANNAQSEAAVSNASASRSA